MTVSWTGGLGQLQQVERVAFISNWESYDFNQSDWSGGSGQAIWSDVTRYDSDDGNVDVSVTGEVSLTGSAATTTTSTLPTAICSAYNWDFVTSTEYAYDSSVIEVTSSLAQLVVQATLSTTSASWPFTTSSNYTYNASNVSIAGGTASLIQQPPTGTFVWDFGTPADYTLSSTSLQVTGGTANFVTLGTLGDIATALSDTLEFDLSSYALGSAVQVSTNTYAIAYQGAGSDGFVTTFQIADDGTIGAAVIDTLEFNTAEGRDPSISHVTGDVYVVGYRGGNTDGFLTTFTIDAAGNISAAIDTYEHNTSQGLDHQVVRIADGYVAVFYRGPGNDGFVETYQINGAGTIITPAIDSLEYDTASGIRPYVLNVGTDMYAVFYRGSGGDGFVGTLDIQSNGTIAASFTDTLEFDTANADYIFARHVSTTIYAMSYRGNGNDGFVATLDIQANGTIGGSTIDSYEYYTADARDSYITRVLNSPFYTNIYALVYEEDASNDGFIQTFTITDTGTIAGTAIDSVEYDVIDGRWPVVLSDFDDQHVIIHRGNGNDGFADNWFIRNKLYDHRTPSVTPAASTSTGAVDSWTDFMTTETGSGTIYYQLSDDDGSTWQYWTGAAWAAITTSTDYNVSTTIASNIAAFSTSTNQITYRALFVSNGLQPITLDRVEIPYSTGSSGYPSGAETITPTNTVRGLVHSWDSFATIESTPSSSQSRYQLSSDGGATWQYWNGAAWANISVTTDANTSSTINTNISSFTTSTGQLTWRAVLEAGTSTPILDQIDIALTLSLPDTNTVGLWHLDEASGNFADTSGNGYDLTANGGPTYSQNGLFGTSVDFQGSEYGTITNAAAPLLNTTTMTFEAWVNVASLANPLQVIGAKWPGNGWYLAVGTGGNVTFGFAAGVSTAVAPGGTVSTGVWHHVAAVYDGTTGYVYVDGVNVASTTAAWAGGATGDFFLSYTTGANALLGTIDEARFSSAVRYTSDFVLPTVPFGDGNSIGYSTARPTVSPTSSYDSTRVDNWASFTETATKNGGEIYYQLSNDSGTNWRYWDGAAWSVTTNTSNYNTAAVVNTNIANFPTSSPSITFRAYLESDGSQLVQLDDVAVSCNAFQMELGTVSTDENWVTVNTTNTFMNPVVVATNEFANNTESISVRIRNIASSSFDIRVQNPTDQNVNAETITYYVVEDGYWTVDGMQIAAGSLNTNQTGSQTGGWGSGVDINFTNAFAAAPIVLHNVASDSDTAWISSAIRDQASQFAPPTTAGFRAMLNGSAVATTHGAEDITWVAFDQGIYNDSTYYISSVQTADAVLGWDNGCYTQAIGGAFVTTPYIMTSQLEVDGTDGGWGVSCGSTATTIDVVNLEDQVGDAERAHTTETFGVVSAEIRTSTAQSGSVAVTTELGTVSTDENWTTVNLTQTYTDPPVVVVSHEFANNTESVSARVRNVTTSSFEVRIHSPQDLNVSAEEITYLVMEAGSWDLNGMQVEAGTSTISTVGSLTNTFDVGTPITFNTAFPAAPIVMSTVVTENDTSWITSGVTGFGGAVTSPSATGFDLMLNGSEVTNTHGAETIAWIAFESNVQTTIASTSIESILTAESVLGWDDGCYTQAFTTSFASTPLVMTGQQKFNGNNGGWGVTCSRSIGSTDIVDLEDRVLDTERTHTTEIFGVFAAAGVISYTDPSTTTSGSGSYATSGSLISSALDTGTSSYPQVVEWTEDLTSCAPNCAIQLQIRGAADSGGSPGTWSSWYGASGVSTYFVTSTGSLVPLGFGPYQWLQYRAEFTGDGTATPILSDVMVNYR